MSANWTRNRGGICWTTEDREATHGGGKTLRLRAADSQAEWLRFDCFRNSPHWHLDPSHQNEVFPLDERDDVVAETMGLLRDELSALLRRAGANEALSAEAKSVFSGAEGRLFARDLDRALRHRPAQLDELDRVVLEARRSEKWHTYPRDVLPAWVAEMDFPVAAAIQDELQRFTTQTDFGYPIGLRETGLAEVFAERMQERFDWHPDPAQVEILSEVVQGMYVSLLAFAGPGEGVVVQTPIYPPFLGSVRETERRLVANPLVRAGDRFELDLDGLRAGIDPETRVLMFCNPHNPTGRVFARSELEALAEICLEHDLTIVSDEIHGDLVFPDAPGRHIPFGSLAPEVARRTVTLTSPSKAFNMPGLRCAIAHFGSDALKARFGSALPRHVRGGIGLPGLYASIAAWRSAQPWLDEVLPYLRANRDFAQQTLSDRIPEIQFHRPEATYLAWLDASELGLEGSPAAHFLRQGRVALSDGRAFGEGWERYVRLNFGTSRALLGDIIDRMATALGR